ncbi:MAG TPA: multicopper oxidase domain-containing protein [Gemmatimonadaceae bacterium]|nr:multicopper oxidase domain-containing protein [Gemmatimonadaceae bacterium]
MLRSAVRLFPALALAVAASFTPGADRIVANDNRRSAGSLEDGVLTVNLEARISAWYPNGDAAPSADMMAFAEAGKPAQVPGPLVRVAAGTRVRGTLRNTLPNDTMLVYGLHTRAAGAKAAPPIAVPPGETRPFDFQLDAPGTYLYWATTMHRDLKFRTREDAQLSGAIVVDERGKPTPKDRVFVIGMWSDTVGGAIPHGRNRMLFVMNGRSWPETERLDYTVGDTVRWHIINASGDLHPMHLHGFYFRVDSRGDGTTDSTYAPEDRDLLVTQLMEQGHTMHMTWVPDRDGNWAFHCHIPEHIMARAPLGMKLPPGDAHMANHAVQGMSGLMTGIHVSPRRGEPSTASRGDRGRRAFRLVVSDVPNADRPEDLRFALAEGRAAPARDTVARMGPPIVVNAGESVSVTVVNTTHYPTSVHWHGLELESYFDGIAGFSGTPAKLAPVIAPSDSFEARFTPPRPGTFIYHSHVDEGRQQPMGLIGAIIVLPKGQRYDPRTELLAVMSSPIDSLDEMRTVAYNGSLTPAPIKLEVGTSYRLRLINITTARPGLRVSLREDGALARWRVLARDGADVADEKRAARDADTPITIGQTIDVEITPTKPGRMLLAARANIGPLAGGLEFVVGNRE